jgi:hypothetical protein
MIHGVRVDDGRAHGSSVIISLWTQQCRHGLLPLDAPHHDLLHGASRASSAHPLELLTTTLVASTTDSTEDSDRWVGVDSSGPHNPEDLCQFMTMNDYLFGYPDSNEDDYDPSRECFSCGG